MSNKIIEAGLIAQKKRRESDEKEQIKAANLKAHKLLGLPPTKSNKVLNLLGFNSFGSSNGPTAYQNKVNALTGALGPASSAFWPNNLKTTGAAYSLGAQPLYYAPQQGFYVTAADKPAAQGSVNFSSFGFGGRRRRRSRKWIQSINLKKGSLRRLAPKSAYTKRGTLKKSWLRKMSRKRGTIGKKARFAITLGKISKRRSRRRRSRRSKQRSKRRSKRRSFGFFF